MSHNDEYCLDLERISNSLHKLEAGGWYYGHLSNDEAINLLKSTPVGTFLMRDSSNSACLFTLSVKTEKGPTSIRVLYEYGQFKLDAEDMIAGDMPLFDCVVQLVDYYVALSRTQKAKFHVWVDSSGRRDCMIYLDRPLIHQVPRLGHLCRLAFNANSRLQKLQDGTLPKTIRAYLNEYPYLR